MNGAGRRHDVGVLAVADNSAFISYRRGDGYPWARLIWDELHNRSINAFLDLESMRQAGRFDERILNQIAARPYFLVVLAEDTLDRCRSESDWVRREIEHAIETERIIVPLFIAPFDPSQFPPDLPPHIAEALANSNGVTFYSQFLTAALDQVAEFLRPVTLATGDLTDDDAEFEQRAIETVCAEPAPPLPPPVVDPPDDVAQIRHEPVPPPPPPSDGADTTTVGSDDPGESAGGSVCEAGEQHDRGDVAVTEPVGHEPAADADQDVAASGSSGGAGDVATESADEVSSDAVAHGDRDSSVSSLVTDDPDDDVEPYGASTWTTHHVTDATADGASGRRSRSGRLAIVSVLAAVVVVALGVVAWSVLSGGDSSTLGADEWLESGDSIVDGDAELTMLSDGRLDLTYRGRSLLWFFSDAPHQPSAAAVFQGDGNFVTYPFRSPPGTRRDDAIWATRTQNQGGTELRVVDTGSTAMVTIDDDDGHSIWDSRGS